MHHHLLVLLHLHHHVLLGHLLFHLLELLLALLLRLMRLILDRRGAERQAATAALDGPENELHDGETQHQAVLVLVGHAVVVPLVVALVLRRRLVEAADARVWVERAGEHEADTTDVAASEEAVANRANVARPEPKRAYRHQNEIAGHDDSPGSVIGPDERPTSAHLPAGSICVTEVKQVLIQRRDVILQDPQLFSQLARSFCCAGIIYAQDIKGWESASIVGVFNLKCFNTLVLVVAVVVLAGILLVK